MRRLAGPALTSIPSRRGCELVTASIVMAGCEPARVCAWVEFIAMAAQKHKTTNLKNECMMASPHNLAFALQL
jgi:hypothetical protein